MFLEMQRIRCPEKSKTKALEPWIKLVEIAKVIIQKVFQLYILNCGAGKRFQESQKNVTEADYPSNFLRDPFCLVNAECT